MFFFGEVIDFFVMVRNLGNLVWDLVVGIVEIDGNGTLVGELGMLLSSEGWVVIVFSRIELDVMVLNESG